MSYSRVSRLATTARVNGWWIVPQIVVVVVMSATVGLWGLWAAYAMFNSVLVWQYANQHGPRNRRRSQLMLKVLAIPLLPVGILSTLTSGGGMSPQDKVGVGSPDEGVRRASIRATSAGTWGGSY